MTEDLATALANALSPAPAVRHTAECQLDAIWEKSPEEFLEYTLRSNHPLAAIYVVNNISSKLPTWGHGKVASLCDLIIAALKAETPVAAHLLRVLDKVRVSHGLDPQALFAALETNRRRWCQAVSVLLDHRGITPQLLSALVNSLHHEQGQEACEAARAVCVLLKEHGGEMPPESLMLVEAVYQIALRQGDTGFVELLPLVAPLMTQQQVLMCLEHFVSALLSGAGGQLASAGGAFISEYAIAKEALPAEHVNRLVPALVGAKGCGLCMGALTEVVKKAENKKSVVEQVLGMGQVECVAAVAEGCQQVVREVSPTLPVQVAKILPQQDDQCKIAVIECLDVLRTVYACEEGEDEPSLPQLVPLLVTSLVAETSPAVASSLSSLIQATVQELSADDVYPLLQYALPPLLSSLNTPSPLLPYTLKAVSSLGYVAGCFGEYVGGLCQAAGGIMSSAGQAEVAGAALECGGCIIAVEEVPQEFVEGCFSVAARYLQDEDVHLRAAAVGFYSKMVILNGDDMPGLEGVLHCAVGVLNQADPSEASIERRTLEVCALEFLGSIASGASERVISGCMEVLASTLLVFAVHPHVPLRAPSLTSLERLLFTCSATPPPVWVPRLVASIKQNLTHPHHHQPTTCALTLLSGTLITDGFVPSTHPDFSLLNKCVES